MMASHYIWAISGEMGKISLDYVPEKNTCTIQVEDKDIKDRLYHAFSTPNNAKKFVKGPQRHWIPDNIYFITPMGSFNFGLAELIISWIQENIDSSKFEWEISDKFKEKYTFLEEVKFRNKLKFSLRDYQKEAVLAALKHKFGTFVMGTGAGKTLVIASILDNLFHYKKIKRALILVPDNGLVLQFNDELVNQYGIKQNITLFYDKFNRVDTTDRLIIANRPLFLSRWEQYKKFWTDKIDCLIVDEAHSLKHSNEVSKCISKVHSEYKFGFTGTLAETKEDKFKTIGLLRPVRYEKTSKELRDERFLTDVLVRRLNLVYPEKPYFMSYKNEVLFLENNEYRNQFITKLVFRLGKNTLLLVNHLDHGFTLEDYFKKCNKDNQKQIYFIRGEIDTEIREKIKKLMEEQDNIVCIAITKIFSTGINIKNLHNIVLCSGGKSSITVIQSIGRGLRLHPNKKELNIFDLVDVGYKYSIAHADKRKQIYKSEKIKTKDYPIEI